MSPRILCRKNVYTARPHLKTLILSRNFITELPMEISRLTKLTTLNLSNNCLEVRAALHFSPPHPGDIRSEHRAAECPTHVFGAERSPQLP
mmetsp:Transcript_57509/g.182163  ORF Transcript_57509/g.182163 Transcript_57509/m.182163 type:complete len:91 (+) Transcript_57509:229-501(+)